MGRDQETRCAICMHDLVNEYASPGAGDWSTVAAPKQSYLPGELVEAAEVMGARVLVSSDEEFNSGME